MRVLILGGSGMLGHKLFQLLRPHFGDVSCTMRDERASSPFAGIPLFGEGGVEWGVDAADWPSLERFLRARRPDVVVNAVGIIKQRPAAKAALQSIQINALLPHQLAATLADWGGRLVHFSTDCVFSGRQGRYRESDRSDAEDLYGQTKFLGEVGDAPNAVTLRSSIIGRELARHDSLLDWLLAQDRREVSGYSRAIYSGLTTIEMATVVRRLLQDHPGLSGVYHVASDPISKLDLLTLLARAFHLDVRIHPVDEPAIDRSLNGDRFTAATGYVAPAWPRLVADLAADPTPYAEWRTLQMDTP